MPTRLRQQRTEGTYATYTQNYQDTCKHVWYANNRCEITVLRQRIPEENGRRPNLSMLNKWRVELMWDFWADLMDSKALEIAEENLIIQKANMLKRHAEKALQLQDEAMAYLLEEGFDSSASAVNAIIKGAELERTSRGIGDAIIKMAQMTNDELKDEILKLVARAGENGQIVDADIVPEKDDTESTA